MTLDLRLETEHMMAGAVGADHGITDAEMEELIAEGRRVHAELEVAREAGGLEFERLPGLADRVAPVKELAERLAGRFEDLVVLGIGGSALGTIAVHAATRARDRGDGPRRPRLHVLDNVDPERIHEALDGLDPERTLVNVISKSGGTAETAAQFLIFREWLENALGDRAGSHLVVTTDASKGPLREIADQEGLASLVVPDGVGGRFSVLTPVGLFPLAMAGVDIDELLQGAGRMVDRCRSGELLENPAYLHGALLYALDRRKGKAMHVLMPYSNALRDVADWFRQLWAESLGKKLDREGREVFVGPTPIDALGATDQHSQLQLYAEGPFDKVVTFLRVDRFRRDVTIPSRHADRDAFAYLGGRTLGELLDAECAGTMVALTEASRPNSTVRFPEIREHTVGQFLMMMEIQTAFCGGLYGIDAFDQPGVEASKIATYALLGRPGFEQRREEIRGLLGESG